jgi:serine phosphatase RsbU (regulator of sigma subunit)
MNMMISTEGTLDVRQSATRNRLERETKRKGDASQGLPATAKSLTAGIQSVKQELDAVRREQGKVQQAIYEAAQIQRKLCAPRELVWGEFEIAGEIFPVRHLSGDFFKVMELGSALGLTVGDIAGKGLSAGIWQAHLMGLIRRSARNHADPAAAVAEVNAELCQDQDEPPIAALFFARLDPQENELVYCNAGLPAPLLLRRNKTVERLEKGGPMLGALQKALYDTGSVRLNSGDMLLAYSDGVTECRNSEDEEFEMRRLSAAANEVSGASANQVLFSTLGAVLDFADASSPEDDLTLLVIRRREGTMTERSPSHTKDFSAPHRGPASVVRPKKAERRGNRSK